MTMLTIDNVMTTALFIVHIISAAVTCMLGWKLLETAEAIKTKTVFTTGTVTEAPEPKDAGVIKRYVTTTTQTEVCKQDAATTTTETETMNKETQTTWPEPTLSKPLIWRRFGGRRDMVEPDMKLDDDDGFVTPRRTFKGARTILQHPKLDVEIASAPQFTVVLPTGGPGPKTQNRSTQRETNERQQHKKEMQEKESATRRRMKSRSIHLRQIKRLEELEKGFLVEAIKAVIKEQKANHQKAADKLGVQINAQLGKEGQAAMAKVLAAAATKPAAAPTPTASNPAAAPKPTTSKPAAASNPKAPNPAATPKPTESSKPKPAPSPPQNPLYRHNLTFIKTGTIVATDEYNSSHNTTIDMNAYPRVLNAHGDNLDCLFNTVAAGVVMMSGSQSNAEEIKQELKANTMRAKTAIGSMHSESGTKDVQKHSLDAHNMGLLDDVCVVKGKINGHGMADSSDAVVLGNILYRIDRSLSIDITYSNQGDNNTGTIIFSSLGSIIDHMQDDQECALHGVTNGRHFSLLLPNQPKYVHVPLPKPQAIRVATDAVIEAFRTASERIRALPNKGVDNRAEADKWRMRTHLACNAYVNNPNDDAALAQWENAEEKYDEHEAAYRATFSNNAEAQAKYIDELKHRRAGDIAHWDRILQGHVTRAQKELLERAFNHRAKLYAALLKDFNNDAQKLDKAISKAAGTETPKTA